MTERIERIESIMARTSMKRTTIYAKIKEGKFPPGFRRARARCWLESEIDELIRDNAAGRPWRGSAAIA
jgi:predicted DNA-binding transcriptional regulator AlpA